MVHNATESYGMIPSTTHARRIRLTRLNELIENLKRCLFFHSKLEPFKIFICLKKRYLTYKYFFRLTNRPRAEKFAMNHKNIFLQ